MSPAIRMRIGDWYVDEHGVLTREIKGARLAAYLASFNLNQLAELVGQLVRAGYEEATRAGRRAQGKAARSSRGAELFGPGAHRSLHGRQRNQVSAGMFEDRQAPAAEWVEEEERAGRHAPPLKRCEVYLDGTNPGGEKPGRLSPALTASLRPRLGASQALSQKTRPHKT